MNVKKVIFAFALFICGHAPFAVFGYQFGTAWDESYSNGEPTDAQYLDDLKDRGLNFRNVYIRWSEFENSGDNGWNTAYINQKRAEILAYRQAGFDVVIRINFFPVPAWYFTAYPQARFKNQYDVTWDPETHGSNDGERHTSAVSIWNDPAANPYQSQFAAYLARVFSEFGTNFWAVYLSAGQYGEVLYPTLENGGTRGEDFMGNTNCYWAWDANARAALAAAYAGDPRLTDILNFKPGLPGPKDPYAGERLINGGFEDTYYLNMLGSGQAKGISGWRHSVQVAADKPASWLPEIMTSGSQSGSQHLRLNGQGGDQYYLRQLVPVVPGRTYTLEGYIKVSGASQGMLRLRQWDGNTTAPVLLDTLILSATATSWTHVSQSVTMNASAQQATVDVYLDTGSTQAEFDALSLNDGQATDHYAAEKFLTWYHNSLTDYINWLILAVRTHYPTGRLFLMGGGFASMAGDVEAEVQQDLMGRSKNNYWVRRGAVPDRYLAGITAGNRTNLYFVNTALEQRNDRGGGEASWESGPLYTDYSPPHYFAKLAEVNSLAKFGENSGADDYWGMSHSFQNMQDYAYEGLAWAKTYELYEPYLNHATIKDYAAFITTYGGPAAKLPTGGAIWPIATGWEGDAEPRGYDNVYNYTSGVETYDPAEFGLPLCTRASAGNKGVTPHAGNGYLVVAGKVTASASDPSCYYWLFNDALIPYHNITITSQTKLRYWIYPYDDLGDATDGNRCVAVDLLFSNGTALRDHAELTDQNGFSVHPAQRHDRLTPNAWNFVEVSLAPVAGLTIQQVWVAFDDPNYASHGEKYRAYIDDLSFADPPTPTPTATQTPVYTPTATPTPKPTYPLGAAIPNPFLPTLGQTLDFSVDEYGDPGAYQIRIYNLSGKLIKTLENTDRWDGRNQNGNYCEGGIYFYQVQSGSRTYHGKVVLLK